MIFAAIPLIIVFSLCYAATRHEEMKYIIPHAAYFGGWLAFFLVISIVLMELLQRWNT
jgi:Ca2+/H+ antiporter